jgi:CMP-N-acetylneuraminic acid synthetase
MNFKKINYKKLNDCFMKKIKKNYTIALIPAKKISRGLKNKNMRKINGKSLSEIAIMNAKKSKYIDKIYVSTDSKKISLLAKKYDVNLINRPSYLCQDHTESKKVIMHFIKNLPILEKKKNNTIVYLQPTSPLRNYKDIDKAIKNFNLKKSDSLISVSKLDSKFLKVVKLDNNILTELNRNMLTKNRQKLNNFYFLDGFIFIFTIKKFLEQKNFLNKSIPYFTPKLKSIDIDNYSSYKYAKEILKNENWK